MHEKKTLYEKKKKRKTKIFYNTIHEKKEKNSLFVYFKPKDKHFFYLTIKQGPQKSIWAAGAKLAPTIHHKCEQIMNDVYIRIKWIKWINLIKLIQQQVIMIMSKYFCS